MQIVIRLHARTNVDTQTSHDSVSHAHLRLRLFPLSWGGLSGHWLSGFITIIAVACRARSILGCVELRCGAEHTQIPLTQQATATAVTEGTDMLTETKKIGGVGVFN